MFDLRDAAGVLMGAERMPQGVRRDRYIRMSAFDSSTLGIGAAVVHRQPAETGAGFRLERHEVNGRNIRYTTKSYAVDRPEGVRYGDK